MMQRKTPTNRTNRVVDRAWLERQLTALDAYQRVVSARAAERDRDKLLARVAGLYVQATPAERNRAKVGLARRAADGDMTAKVALKIVIAADMAIAKKKGR